MNDMQLKSFLEAAKCLNFTKASKHLYITQSVLSRQIAALERELGMPLFYRNKNTVRLTEAGRIFAEDMSRLQEMFHETIHRLSELRNEESTYLKFGMLEGLFIESVMRNVFANMWRDPAKVTVQLIYFSLRRLGEALLDGDVDIMFISEDLIEPFAEEVETKLVREGKSCLVMSTNHPLAERDDLTLADFRNDPFILLDKDEYPLMSRLQSEVSAKRGAPDKQIAAPNFDTLALWIEANVGISTMVSWNPLNNNPKLKFVELPELRKIRELAAWRKDNENPSIGVFLKAVDSIKV